MCRLVSGGREIVMREIIQLIVAGYLLSMSIIGFLTMGVDKRRAIKSRWRIPERTLLGIALLGGGIGSYLGMKCYRHKTKHRSFRLLLPLSAVGYLLLAYYYLF